MDLLSLWMKRQEVCGCEGAAPGCSERKKSQEKSEADKHIFTFKAQNKNGIGGGCMCIFWLLSAGFDLSVQLQQI